MGLNLPNLSLPTIRLDNPLNTVQDTFAAPFVLGANMWNSATNYLDPRKQQEQMVNDLKEGLDPALQRAEDAARIQNFRDAMDDRSIDTVTKDEITALYNAGGDSSQIGGLLAAAREGNGIYAVRKVNYARQIIEKDMPGRQQLAAISPKSGAPGGSIPGR